MMEDQHEKEAVQAAPSFVEALHCSEVLFGSSYWP